MNSHAFDFRRKYREHNAYVRRYCPKTKLLVMNVKDGWAPLVSFLETKTPEIEFPFRNKVRAKSNTYRCKFLKLWLEQLICKHFLRVATSLKSWKT